MVGGPLDPSGADAGDCCALDELLVRNLGLLRAFVRLRVDERTRQHESVSDLVESVCREVLKRRDRFEFRSEPEFRAWLFGAVANKLRDRWDHHDAERRNPARLQHQSSLEDVAEAYRTTLDPVGNAMRREDCERFEAAFSLLTPIQRDVLTLRYLVGLDYEAIAAQLASTAANMRSIAARGRARLAGLIGMDAGSGH